MTRLNGSVVGRGAAYIFIETMVGFISGFLLWVILTRITSSEDIGISSTVISLATIFTTAASIGIPDGVSRYLAKSFSNKNFPGARIFLKSSLILLCIGIVASAILLILIKDIISVHQELSLLISAIVFMCSSVFGSLFYSTILATLRTKISSLIMVVASCSRTVVAVILVLADTGALGIVIGYALCELLGCVLLAIAISRILRDGEKVDKSNSVTKLTYPFRSILSASVPYWIPKLIAVLGGASLGTVVVFGSNGSAQAASFFLANSILIAIMATVTPLLAISYPTLSAMSDGRKRFAWRIIKISTIVSAPISISFIFNSNVIIDIFGQNYSDASLFVKILLITVIPATISTMIIQLSYAYGNYRPVLYLGLASSIPRTVLYFVLVPIFGGTGAATSFLIGSAISFALSVIVANNMGLIIHWRDIILVVVISLLSALFFSYFDIYHILGIISSIVTSFVAFLRFKILSRSDVEDTINVLPEGIAIRLTPFLNKVGRVLNKDY